MNTQNRMLKVTPVCLAIGALMLAVIPAWSGVPADGSLLRAACRQGDRGRLIRFERVASFPTAADARAHFTEWIAYYQDFYQFPADLPETFEYGFDAVRAIEVPEPAASSRRRPRGVLRSPRSCMLWAWATEPSALSWSTSTGPGAGLP